MNFDNFHAIIQKRALIDDELYTEIDKCCDEMTAVFSNNIEGTILFLDICTGDEFVWLSEVFDSIASKTRSKDFILAIKKTAEKYPAETREYNIVSFIKSAECIVLDGAIEKTK